MAKGKCKVTTIHIKTRRGPISFRGHSGSGCAPRKKPSTRHLGPYKRTFALAAKQCARRGGGRKAINRCVGQAMRAH